MTRAEALEILFDSIEIDAAAGRMDAEEGRWGTCAVKGDVPAEALWTLGFDLPKRKTEEAQ